MDVKLTAARVASLRPTKALNAMTNALASLRSELDALHSITKCREGVLCNLEEKVWMSYIWLMRTHAASHRRQLNSLSFDAQARGKYIEAIAFTSEWALTRCPSTRLSVTRSKATASLL